MSRMNKTILAMTMVLCVAPATQGIVETFDATISAEVREYLAGDIVNSDSAIEELGETTGNLPLMVEALLQQSETSNTGAGSKVVFSDPRVTLLPDPNEFGIAVVGNSFSSDVSYSAVGSASETRNVIFTSAEMGYSEGTPLSASSYFYVDGLLVIWAEQGSTDLTGASAIMSLSVEQQRPAGGGGTVLQASLNLAGPASGGGGVTFTASGDLCTDNVIQMDISDLMPELGTVQLVLIPDIAIPYPYAATVDEPFTLQAEIEGETSNSPGTGAAVMLGVPLDDMASIIDSVTGQMGVGEDFTMIVQGLVSSGIVAAKPLPVSDGMTKVTVDPVARGISLLPNNPCGILGVESMMLTMLFAGMVMASRRSRAY